MVLAIANKSKKLDGCQMEQPTRVKKEKFLAMVFYLIMCQHQDQGVNRQCTLEIHWDTSTNERQAIKVARYIGIMDVDLIHKPVHDNVVHHVLIEFEKGMWIIWNTNAPR